MTSIAVRIIAARRVVETPALARPVPENLQLRPAASRMRWRATGSRSFTMALDKDRIDDAARPRPPNFKPSKGEAKPVKGNRHMRWVPQRLNPYGSLTHSASSRHGCTDQVRVAAPDGEASTNTTGKSPSACCRPGATAFVGLQ